ncbi:transketolase [Candidatus Woesearchaeota archaeon CG08_land_8_20_14_0_20_43_7]|nr:MAG: transketolase [Candidatus Woesearchaeota archaeon CG08_land_8_20_14_0_20_43_7]
MPIIDSKTKKEIKKLSAEELKKEAAQMRAYMLIAIHAARSGHPGGSLSIMDITAALYLNVARHDPKNPEWEDRDRILFSAGHKAPALYTGLGFSGYFEKDDIMTLRKLHSPFQGHPHWLKCPGIEASTGSLGQGLSIAVGLALAGKLDKKDHKVFCIMGDGEQQEGQVWEAAMEAAHHKLDNLIAIVDKNNLQIDGDVCCVMGIDPIEKKYEAFGWHVIEIDGHNMEEILAALDIAKGTKGKPTVIIAKTVKGKGVDFMENVAGWHGKAPNREELDNALKQLGHDNLPVEKLLKIASDYQTKIDGTIDKNTPKFNKDYWWNRQDDMKTEMKPTRAGFGQALKERGDDKRVVALGCDISGSIMIDGFNKDNPERNNRFLSMGIAEASSTAVAAGLARAGKLPVFGSYGVFASARNLDQLRTTVCYGNFNVFVAGAHGGVSVGPDGATHQALEEFFNVCGLPGMTVVAPCDSVETKKATEHLLFDVKGPKYARFAREKTPIVTDERTPFVLGKANIARFRKEDQNFKDAFETKLAKDYKDEKEDITIISCGPEYCEAMRAAYILKKEYDIEVRVIDMHTVKPIDKDAIVRAAKETGAVLTCEEHQKGGLGDKIASVIALEESLMEHPVVFDMIGIDDTFGESGEPWELVKYFGLTAEHIAAKAKTMVDEKR